MIPTMVLLGLVLGRWWWAALVAALVGWPSLLLVTGVIVWNQVPAAALLALLNAAVGVAIAQAAVRIYRGLRHRSA
jgi:hypothetical protein